MVAQGQSVKAGVYTMSMQDYQRDPCAAPSLSSHVANILNTQSPRHAWFAHPLLNPNHQSEESTDFDLGACAHAVLLEGEGGIYPIEAPDWRKKEAKEARDQARAQGKIPILAHKLTAIRAMADAARAALIDCELGPIDLGTGTAEQVLIWQEGEAWCRARPDWLRLDRKLVIDYKSTGGSAEPAAWIRNQMAPIGYDVQAVHYLRGNAATGGAKTANWIFLVQENYAPYECSFVALSPAIMEIAQRKWEYALALWKLCLKSGKWGGYSKRINYAEPSSWQMAEDDERRLSFDEKIAFAEQG